MRKNVLFIIFLFLVCSSPKNPDLFKGRVLFLGDSITQNGTYVSIIEHAFFKKYPGRKFDFISIGLSGETLSGLSEPGHKPRPWLHDRLDNALKLLPSSTVIACYGMNDGIYHPQSPERFTAYKKGMHKFIDKVRDVDAKMIILTPPLFDPKTKPKTVGADAEVFGYQKAYENYNDVLIDYGEWLLSLNEPDIMVIDLNGPMHAHQMKKRETHSEYVLCPDGVHPNFTGHLIMAQQFLNAIGMPIEKSDVDALSDALQASPLFRKVHERRNLRSYAWLAHVGFKVNHTIKALSVDEAEKKARIMAKEIQSTVNNPYPPILTAHRGASGLAPENTMAAMRKAMESGADYAELDVQETRDGQLILLHDNTLERTTNSKGNIWELTLNDLRDVDAGSWFKADFKGEPIPTLEAVMDEVRGKMKLNIEMKMNGHEKMLAERVVNLVERKNFLKHCMVTSFNRQAIRKVKELNPKIQTGYIFSRLPEENVLEGEYEILSINKRLADKNFIRKAQEHGKEVHVWTVNDPTEMKRLMSLGVNSIITDYPDRLQRLLKRNPER